MIQPVSLYSANGFDANEQSSTYLGYFFYVDGAFRYVDPEVFQIASVTLPTYIREGGNVAAATVVSQVPPVYPDKARKKHIEGEVVLHAIIGKDGRVEELESISGDPLLVEAALIAVKQWTYTPTLLAGTPVKVDTNITVTFTLSKK